MAPPPITFLSQESMPGRFIVPLDYDRAVGEVVSIFFRGIVSQQGREG